MTTFTWQPLSEEHVPLLHATAVARAEHRGRPAPPVEQIAMVLQMLGDNLETQSRIALTADSTAAGAAFFILGIDESGVTALTECLVHPDHESSSLQDDLLNWLKSGVALRVSDTHPQATSVTMRKAIQSDQNTLIPILERHGFLPVRYSAEMNRSLDDLPDQQPLPDGVSFVNYSQDYDDRVRAAFNEAFQEHWGVGRQSEVEWRERFADSHLFRPDLSYLVITDESDVAAFCLTEFRGQQGQIVMEAIGTLSTWRGKGLAASVMVHAMHHYAAAGYETVSLNVDTENMTGALQLYEKLGFVTGRVETVFDCTLTFKDPGP